jgi:hypothetical protein
LAKVTGGVAQLLIVRRLKLMIAPLAKFIDWSALQMAYVVAPLRHVPKPKWKLEEALEFLNGPDFIPAASNAAQIEFDGPRCRRVFCSGSRLPPWRRSGRRRRQG